MPWEWPTKHKNDTKRNISGQNQSSFYLPKRWTEWDNESLLICLIFVRFVCFVGQSSGWIQLGRSDRSAPFPFIDTKISQGR